MNRWVCKACGYGHIVDEIPAVQTCSSCGFEHTDPRVLHACSDEALLAALEARECGIRRMRLEDPNRLEAGRSYFESFIRVLRDEQDRRYRVFTGAEGSRGPAPSTPVMIAAGVLDYPCGWLWSANFFRVPYPFHDGCTIECHPCVRAGDVEGRAEALGVGKNDLVAGIRWVNPPTPPTPEDARRAALAREAAERAKSNVAKTATVEPFLPPPPQARTRRIPAAPGSGPLTPATPGDLGQPTAAMRGQGLTDASPVDPLASTRLRLATGHGKSQRRREDPNSSRAARADIEWLDGFLSHLRAKRVEAAYEQLPDEALMEFVERLPMLLDTVNGWTAKVQLCLAFVLGRNMLESASDDSILVALSILEQERSKGAKAAVYMLREEQDRRAEAQSGMAAARKLRSVWHSLDSPAA